MALSFRRIRPSASLPVRCVFHSADSIYSLNKRNNGSRPNTLLHSRAIIPSQLIAKNTLLFDYYKDELFAILDRQHEFLFDLNIDLLRFFLKKTGIEADIRFTEEFTPYGSTVYGRDLRGVIHPKRQNDILERLGLKKPYWQVFSLKYGFISDLSVMDLLFNEGPDSISYLKRLK